MSKAGKEPAPKCSAEVYRNGNPHPFLCGKKAQFEHEGKEYCATHYPPNVQAKRIEHQNKAAAKRAAPKKQGGAA